MTNDESHWFALLQGTQVGPMSRFDLVDHIDRGELSRSDFIWRPGLHDWIAAETSPGFFTPPPPPKSSEVKVSSGGIAEVPVDDVEPILIGNGHPLRASLGAHLSRASRTGAGTLLAGATAMLIAEALKRHSIEMGLPV
jgi:hypothetical protein